MNRWGLGWMDVAIALERENVRLRQEAELARQIAWQLYLARLEARDPRDFASAEIEQRFPERAA